MNEFDIEQLRIKLKTINVYLYVTGTDYGRLVQNLYKEGKLELVKVEPRDKWLSESYKDFGHKDALFTFKDCVIVELNSAEIVEVVVWDGDNVYGGRTHVRCKFVLSGQWWLLDFLVTLINEKFAKHCLRLAEAEEQAVLVDRALTIQQLVLKQKYNKEKEIVNRVYPGILGKIKWIYYSLCASRSSSSQVSDTNTDE